MRLRKFINYLKLFENFNKYMRRQHDENLFTLYTGPMKNIDYNINNIALKLWNARLENNIIKEEKNDNKNYEECKNQTLENCAKILIR
ncbi:hypothetical protein H8356DRAFT_1428000 [Neocallimastix lanati (nom. inval.)]|nr:hypothetical protein H8356DRAFT_1428000 [Neocallimastix sp. JGI-2020a]